MFKDQADKKVFVCMFKYALKMNIADSDELQHVYNMQKYQNLAGAKELQGSCFPWAAGCWAQWSGHRVPRVQGGDGDHEDEDDGGDES